MQERAFGTLLIAACAVALPALRMERAEAQAFLSPKGEASFSIGYGSVFIRDHYLGSTTFDDGHIRSNTVGLGLDYAVSDRVSADFGVPYIFSKYMGSDPHVALDGSTLDTGSYHGELQDFRFGVRWLAFRVPFVLTPYVAAVVPSHDYRYFAHSAVGRGLRQYVLGFYAARRLDPVLENAYVQLRYSYAFVEKVIGISHDISSADLDLGYFLTSALGARGILSYGYTHGGIVIPDGIVCNTDCGPTDSSPTWQHHDQIGHDVYLNAGLGLSYALTGSLDVTAIYFTSLYGENGHKINQGLSFGVSWSFSPVQVYRQLAGKPRSES
jgi:opacity protein-like surface antigen